MSNVQIDLRVAGAARRRSYEQGSLRYEAAASRQQATRSPPRPFVHQAGDFNSAPGEPENQLNDAAAARLATDDNDSLPQDTVWLFLMIKFLTHS